MSVSVLGPRELAVVGIGLLSLQQLAVVGVGLCKGGVEPFDVADNLRILHGATQLAYEHQYPNAGACEPVSAREIMRAIGQQLGIHDQPIKGSIEGQLVWEFYDTGRVHEKAWHYMRKHEDAVKEARVGAWSLVYNAMDNSGKVYMTDEAREIAMYVCQALLIVDT
jgi:hypothetical protein